MSVDVDREKVMKGLECCSNGLFCEDDCPYAEIRDSDGPEDNCIAALARDALEVIESLAKGGRILSAPTTGLGEDAESYPAHIVPRELLMHTWGHGFEERHYRGDDEDPESITVTECVWINGQIKYEDGSSADADSDYWREHYGKKYGVRIWAGNESPTEEQRKGAPWA